MARKEEELKQVGGAGGGKGGGGSAYVPYEAPDSLRSSQFIEIIEAVSEGEIEGWAGADLESSVFIDDTPLKSGSTLNFKGFQVDFRPGTQDQTYIPTEGMDGGTGAPVQVGLLVRNSTGGVVRTITDPDVDMVRITIQIPRLLRQNKENGDVLGTEVRIAVDVQPSGSTNYTTVDLKGRDLIKGKSSGTYFRDYLINLKQYGDAPYNIRLRRITPDSDSVAVNNEVYWSAYTEIKSVKLTYPNTALFRIRIDAKQFSSVPRRGYLIRGIKCRVPSNYDPPTHTYTGTWDGSFKIAWTDNPVWIFLDLVTESRYGLGKYIDDTMLDMAVLYQAAQYCDEPVDDGFGGSEPRFTCNVFIQTQEDAIKVLRDLASLFRSIIFWSGGQVSLAQDRDWTPTWQYTAANVIEGRFNYSGVPRNNRFTVALVAWNNPAQNYKPAIEYVENPAGIARYGHLETRVLAFGTTSRAQARRVGKHILLSSQLETETVTFQVGLDGLYVTPGEVGKIVDPLRSSTYAGGGRIQSSTLSSVVLDREITLEPGKTYTITLFKPNGTLIEFPVTSPAGTITPPNPVSFGTTLVQGEEPLPDSVWTLTEDQTGDQLYRILSVSEVKSAPDSDKGVFEITAVKHDPSKYAQIDSSGLLPPEEPPVIDRSGIQPPSGLVVSEGVYVTADGLHRYIDISWIASPGPYLRSHVVRWVAPDGEQYEQEVETQTFRLVDPTVGDYSFIVYAKNTAGIYSTGISQAITLTELPPIRTVQITGLELKGQGTDTNFKGPSPTFSWRLTSLLAGELGSEVSGGDQGNPDPWLLDYEIRVYDGQSNLLRTEHTTRTEYTYLLDFNKEDTNGQPTRTIRIEVYARDRYNRLSDPAELTVTNPPPTEFREVKFTSGIESILVTYFPPLDPDYKATRVYASENQGFVPDDTTLRYEGTDHVITLSALESSTYYIKLEGVDEFGPAGVYSSEFKVDTFSAQRINTHLAGRITESWLYNSLRQRIDLIDGDGPGSVNERIANIETSGIQTWYQGTAPAVPPAAEGDLWFDTGDNNHPYILQNGTWTDARDSGVTGVSTYFYTGDPSTWPNGNAVGDLAFRTDDGNRPYRWDGAQWVDIRDGAVPILVSEWTLKVDINGHVAGMGVAVQGTQSGPISSDILMLADRFSVALPAVEWQANRAFSVGQYVRPTDNYGSTGVFYRCTVAGTTGGSEPTWPTGIGQTVTDGSITWTAVDYGETVPFVVGTVNGNPVVVMNQAIIGDATITDAKIVDLKADKISSGTLNVGPGGYIDVGGPQFRLTTEPNKQMVVTDTQTTPQKRVELGQFGNNATDYGIVIRDSAGNIMLSSGYPGLADEVNVDTTNLGDMALLNFIDANNSATYIKTAAIKNAHIADGEITNAKIGNIIQSNNFVAGQSGWQIDKDGGIEASEILIRDSSGRVVLQSTGQGTLFSGRSLVDPSVWIQGYIASFNAFEGWTTYSGPVDGTANQIIQTYSRSGVAFEKAWRCHSRNLIGATSSGMASVGQAADPRKTYMFAAWVRGNRSNSTSGGFYLGPNYVPSSANDYVRVQDGIVTPNPYFLSGWAPGVNYGSSQVNTWYLAVGYVRAYNDVSTTNYGRLYAASGNEVAVLSDYRWASSSINIDYHGIRGLVYGTNATGDYLDILGPAIYEVDGTQPDPKDLIAKGNFAFIDQITPGNVSTYIASAAIGNAQIGNAAVDTLQIAGNAVTIPASSLTEATIYTSSWPNGVPATPWQTIQSLTTDTKGAGAIIRASCDFNYISYQSNPTYPEDIEFRIITQNTVLLVKDLNVPNIDYFYQPTPSGPTTYYYQARSHESNPAVRSRMISNRFLSVFGARR